jgi:arsenite oxidase small subunit
MERCRALADVGRRQFLRGGGVAAAGAAAAVVVGGAAKATGVAPARVTYPVNRLGNIADLKPNEPFEVAYPDGGSPGVLLKLGTQVATGAGPDGDIVGFSTLCPHKGFPLRYTAGEKAFDCPGHYSRFDAENGGMQIWGQATQNLPQFQLTIDAKGDIYASGVDELIYGRLSNVL